MFTVDIRDINDGVINPSVHPERPGFNAVTLRIKHEGKTEMCYLGAASGMESMTSAAQFV